MAFDIVPIKDEDYEEWSEVWQKYLEFYKTSLPETQYKSTFARIVAADGDLEGLIAKEDGKIVGLSHFLFHSSCWTDQSM